MKKLEALEIMLQGGYIRHQNYSREEHIHMEGSHIIDESGYDMGTIHGEFWSQIQKWEDGWEEVETINNVRDSAFKPKAYQYTNHIINRSIAPLKVGRYVPVRTEPKVQRNEPCTCGGGMKFKQCCGIVK